MSGKSLKRRRQNLFKKYPYCHWCGVALTLNHLPRNRVPENFATIDHLYSRLDPRRGLRTPREVTVLSCPPCNNKRGKEEQASLPKEELWRRSGAYPGIGYDWKLSSIEGESIRAQEYPKGGGKGMKLVPSVLQDQVMGSIRPWDPRRFAELQAHVRIVMPSEAPGELLALLGSVIRVGGGFLLVVDEKETGSGEQSLEHPVNLSHRTTLRIFEDVNLPQGVDDYQLRLYILRLLPDLLDTLPGTEHRVTREVKIYPFWQSLLTLKPALDEAEGGVYLDVEDYSATLDREAEEWLS